MANKMKNDNSSIAGIFLFICFVIIMAFISLKDSINYINNDDYEEENGYRSDTFSIITTPENKVLEDTIKKYAEDKDLKVSISYADNLEIVDKLNSGEKYDAIWASNSIWLDMLDSSVKTSNLKSTSITPIVFGIKKSKAKELGLIDKDVTMDDLLKLIRDGKLNFSMANPIMTNSGASAYFNIISTLAGNPEVLKHEHLEDKKLQEKLKTFFRGLERTAGDEDFLEKSFVNGEYDAAISYESSIININKELEKNGKETLYLIYPVDGVSICDSPLVFMNNGDEGKKENFLDFQAYILGKDGQSVLASLGRRTWYGGITDSADETIFNPSWGIDTTKYISSVKYPSKDIIREALRLYQDLFRKPVHVVFCLDYSGSMGGKGIESLIDAMEYIFGDRALTSMIQFSSMDKIDIIPFNGSTKEVWRTGNGSETEDLLNKIKNFKVGGGTDLYDAIEKGLLILKDESSEYNLSIIAMTDGVINMGSYEKLSRAYKSVGKNIPIYSIMFGNADEEQLISIANLTNGKVFDGKKDLAQAFKLVRGYN
ncbi:MAG: VWA domain-containing protein [Clostridia bacterium]|nr:VWA domain-containing protein [Clostridia bacterium]